MTTTFLLARLGLATLAFTAVAGLLVLARRGLRARLGAQAAYALWLAVPLGVALCCWPVHVEVVAMAAAPGGFADAAAAAPVAGVAAPGLHLADGVALAWLLGPLACALLLWRRQRAFVRTLGPLQSTDGGAWTGARNDLGPMLVGLVRPRIVLPADFARRYTPAEQALVLAHEETHRRRGDLWWNALAAALRCGFWFHPLFPAMQRRYLEDQELACDSAVLHGGGHAPRTYAEALLKTATGMQAPLGCAMQAAAPLRERLLNLDRRGSARGALLAVATLLLAGGTIGGRVAWAASAQVVAQAPAAAAGAAYKVVLDLSVDGAPPRHEEAVVRGTLHLEGLRDGEGRACVADIVPSGLPDGVIDIRMRLTCDGRPAASPRLLARPGEPATVAIGQTERRPDGSHVTVRGFRLTMTFDRP